MNNKENHSKEKEIEIRRAEVENLHLIGWSVNEIAERMKVDPRTISRDIQANRSERLKMLENSTEARVWVQEQLADTIGFLETAKKRFCIQAETFKSETAKTRALWYATEIEIKKMETIKSLIWSSYDIEVGGNQLKYEKE